MMKPLVGFLLLASVLPLYAQEQLKSAAAIKYIIFEGGGPDQGPGPNLEQNVAALQSKFGKLESTASRQYGYGLQQLRILTRSATVVAADVEHALDVAERTGVPIWLHVDPLYAWGADTEVRQEDAPTVKFWEDPEMREWGEFPRGSTLPSEIPRLWFNWGSWCSPVAAVPAIGSPKFVTFVRAQLAAGVLQPLAARLEKWNRAGRSHLFAGINIGWETHLPAYASSLSQDKPIVAAHPKKLAGTPMDPRLAGMQLGYASLHWRGWSEARLIEAAQQAGRTRDEQFRQLCYETIHAYMETLARDCHQHGIAADQIYTHIVALATVQEPSTNAPPIWTAVNRFSIPGFTLDNQGAAKFHLHKLVDEVARAPGSRRAGFGAVETYVRLGSKSYVTDAQAYTKELTALFEAGARIKVIYAAMPLSSGRAPEAALEGIQAWLRGGP